MPEKSCIAICLCGILVWCGAGPVGEKLMSASSAEAQYVYDMRELEDQRAATGGPWLEFLRVPSMYCGVYHLPAGSRDGQSPHDEDEVYYVQSGRSRFHVDGEDFDIGPGNVLFVPAGKVHYFHEIEEDLTLLVFFSNGPVAER